VDRQHRSRLKSIVTSLHRTLAEQGRVTGEVIETTGGLVPVGGMLAPWGMLRNVPVLLAGDAAGLNHPITGAGIAAAVYSGRLAGAAATDWIAGDRQAGPQYQEELESVFKTTLDRAVRRRRELGRMLARKARPAKHALRRGWIAYPEYWAHGR
jgi:flavin-dependent dehydrogenase